MSIRPLLRSDIPAVARLHANAQPNHRPDAAARLASFFERTLLDAPSADPEIPSLVATEGEAVVGFLGSYVRAMELDGKPVRLACSAHLLTDRSVRSQGLGALLLRTYLDGPQDATITDGATRGVQRMWEALGGSTVQLQSLAWIEPIRPAALATHRLAQRLSAARLESALKPLSYLVDLPARRLVRAADAPVEAAPVDVLRYAETVAEVSRSFALRPVYDEAYLTWLFGELRRIASEPPVFPDRVPRGPLEVGTVATGGRTVGAYVCQIRRDGVCRVLSAVARERDAGAVLAAIRARAELRGASGIFGRVEPHLMPALMERNTFLRFGSGRMLVASSNSDLERAPTLGRALLTRLDGEWW